MRVQSVRFGPDQWETISRAAGVEGVTIAQFVRDSAFVRAWIVVLRDRDECSVLWDLVLSHPELLKQVRDIAPPAV
jgi:hypothetical protein